MNIRLKKLLQKWKRDGAIEQEGFDWNASKNNWTKAFPNDSKFIQSLAGEIDREHVRSICNDSRYEVKHKFLSVMIWGYGDRGYGPYRVGKMLSQKHSESVILQAFKLCQSGEPISAYEFLKENRIHTLGPAYGTKFMSFCTPREVGAPIYDSLISLWVREYAQKEFLNISTSSENWNLKTYTSYWQWIKEHANALECYPDQVELVLFRDAESKFAKSSNWANK